VDSFLRKKSRTFSKSAKIEREETWPPPHRDSAKTLPDTMRAHNTLFYFCSKLLVLQRLCFILQQLPVLFIFAAAFFYLQKLCCIFFTATFSYMLHKPIQNHINF